MKTTRPTKTVDQSQKLCESVGCALRNYFSQLNEETPQRLHKMVIEEIEPSLFEAVMKYAKNNQSLAAKVLGLSRGTVIRKLKDYGFPQKGQNKAK